MFVRIKPKKRKPKKDDYSPNGIYAGFPSTKWERRSLHLRRPDLVKVAERRALIFELVESFRDERGRPRQRARYLASIGEEYLDSKTRFPVRERELFWKAVLAKFAVLRLDAKAVEKHIAEISEHVPRPTLHQLSVERERVRQYYSLEE